jgi:mannose-6-phosphate isomerase-like protein (cupin superfamily)
MVSEPPMMPLHSMSKIIEKSWGYEKIIENGQYCMKLLVYTRPIASSLHYHARKHETFYVASGKFRIEWGHKRIAWTFEEGDHLALPPGTPHRVRCLVPGVIVEASSHDDPQDCVRLEPSES